MLAAGQLSPSAYVMSIKDGSGLKGEPIHLIKIMLALRVHFFGQGLETVPRNI